MSTFSDDFSGDLSAWTTLSGTWEIVDGKLDKTSSIGHEVIEVDSISESEGTIQVEVESVTNLSGVVFRLQDVDNYYFASIDGANKVRLSRTIGGVSAYLINAAHTFSSGTFYTLKVVYYTVDSGIRIKVYIDDVLKLNYSESTAAISDAGKIGCQAYSQNASFDDISYTSVVAKTDGGAFLMNFI